MLSEKNGTLHTHHPSLLPLRMALTLAEKGSPSRPRRMDSNERLAMQLIARMQSRYKRTHPFLSPAERFRRLAGTHAR